MWSVRFLLVCETRQKGRRGKERGETVSLEHTSGSSDSSDSSSLPRTYLFLALCSTWPIGGCFSLNNPPTTPLNALSLSPPNSAKNLLRGSSWI